MPRVLSHNIAAGKPGGFLNPLEKGFMAGDDVHYLEKRAEAELELAQSATHACAVRAHYEMATAYLDRIYQDDGAAPEQA